MMTYEMINSILTVIGSLVGTFGGVISGMKLMNYKLSVLDDKITVLEKKFDKYVIEPRIKKGDNVYV